jgi:hypothetical protein
LNILLTNDELHEVRGGTQLFIGELALALKERGCQTAIYSWLQGSIAEEIRAQGVSVVSSPADCGFIPDIIHGQHHLATMAALAAHPHTPAIYHCHGYVPWQERPPVHGRILRYVCMAPALQGWMAEITGRAADDILPVPNAVDLKRFSTIRTPGSSPSRALLFGNTVIPPSLLAMLETACDQCGLALDKMGPPFGKTTSAPQELLPGYDLVFAVGRSAIEAMACGCAVMPFDASGFAPIIAPLTLKPLMMRNFTAPKMDTEASTPLLVSHLREYDAASVSEVTRRVRAEFSFEATTDLLRRIYQETIAAWQHGPRPSEEEDSLSLSAYLAGLGPYIKTADERFEILRKSREEAKAKLHLLQQKHETLQQQHAKVLRRLPSFLRRWLLR